MNFLLDALLFISGCTYGYFLGIALDELGRFICGKLTGYKFLSFQIFNLRWVKNSEGKINFKKSRLKKIYCEFIMKPCEDEKNFKFVLFHLGGGLANIVAGAAFLLICVLFDIGIFEAFLLGLSCFSFFLACFSLVPFKTGSVINSGRNVKEIKKSADAKHAFYISLLINAEMTQGKILEQYPPETFLVSDTADTSNYLVAGMITLNASRLEELGEFEKAHEELLRIDAAKLPTEYQFMVYNFFLFNDLVNINSQESVLHAHKIIDSFNSENDKKMWEKHLNEKDPAIMPNCAAKVAFIDGDIKKAKEIIKEAKELIPTLQSPRTEYSVNLMLKRLESRLDESFFDNK
jgi:hypothetical protein